MARFAPRVFFDATANFGVGAIDLTGAAAVDTSYNIPDASMDGLEFDYVIQHQGNTEHEVGWGVYNHAGLTIARTAGNVEDGSSGAGVLVTFSTGTKRVALTPSARTLNSFADALAAAVLDGTAVVEGTDFVAGGTFTLDPTNLEHRSIKITGVGGGTLTADMTVALDPANVAWATGAQVVVEKGDTSAFTVTVSGYDNNGLGTVVLERQDQWIRALYITSSAGPGPANQKFEKKEGLQALRINQGEFLGRGSAGFGFPERRTAAQVLTTLGLFQQDWLTITGALTVTAATPPWLRVSSGIGAPFQIDFSNPGAPGQPLVIHNTSDTHAVTCAFPGGHADGAGDILVGPATTKFFVARKSDGLWAEVNVHPDRLLASAVAALVSDWGGLGSQSLNAAIAEAATLPAGEGYRFTAVDTDVAANDWLLEGAAGTLVTVTVRLQSVVSVPNGKRVFVLCGNAAGLTIAAEVGVTIRPSGLTLGVDEVALLHHISGDNWHVENLSAAAGGGATLAQGTLGGRGAASGSGVYEQIALGSGLSMAGTTLTSSGTVDWIDVKRDYGAVGDGVIDDTPAIQAAIDFAVPLGRTIWFPAGSYNVTGLTYPDGRLVLRGSGAFEDASEGRTTIKGNVAGPLLRAAGTGILLTYDNVLQQWDRADSPAAPVSDGGRLDIQEIYWKNEHPYGSLIQAYNAWWSNFERCVFDTVFGGVLITQGFNTNIRDCEFLGSHFVTHTVGAAHYPHAYALYVNGHAALSGLSFKGVGTAAHLEGNEITLLSARIETSGYGLVLGMGNSGGEGKGTLAQQIFGQSRQLAQSFIGGVSCESNIQNVRCIKMGGGVVVFGLNVFGGTNGPVSPTEVGLMINGGGQPYQIWRPDVSADVAAPFSVGRIVGGPGGIGEVDFGYSVDTVETAGLISALPTAEQDAISTGTFVVDANGVIWRYKGSGSKTLEASYHKFSADQEAVAGGALTTTAIAITRGKTYYNTVIQGGAITFDLDQAASTHHGGEAIFYFTSDGSAITWTDIVLATTGGAPPSTLPAGTQLLTIVYNETLDRGELYLAQATAAEVSATPHDDIAGGTAQAQLEEIATKRAKLAGGNILTGAQDFSDGVMSRAEMKDISETFFDAGNVSGAVALDYSNGGWQKITLTGDATSLTINNWPATGRGGTLTLEIVQDGIGGRTITWGAAYRFPGGTAYQPAAGAGAFSLVHLGTRDAGSIILVGDGGKAYGT